MDKELALRTFAYLIGHYKTHEETTINSQEIEAINYILDENERLEQQCKKQKEVINKIEEKIKENIKNAEYEITALTITDREYYKYIDDMLNDLLEILKEVSE